MTIQLLLFNHPSGQDSFILPSTLNSFPRKFVEFKKNNSALSFCFGIIIKLADGIDPFWGVGLVYQASGS